MPHGKRPVSASHPTRPRLYRSERGVVAVARLHVDAGGLAEAVDGALDEGLAEGSGTVGPIGEQGVGGG